MLNLVFGRFICSRNMEILTGLFGK